MGGLEILTFSPKIILVYAYIFRIIYTVNMTIIQQLSIILNMAVEVYGITYKVLEPIYYIGELLE